MKFFSESLDKLKKLVSKNEQEVSEERIESARVTSSRLNALKRMRANSPTTPSYKRNEQTTASRKPKKDNIDLDFGMELPNV